MAKFGHKLENKFTSRPDKYPQKWFKVKPCRWCGEDFTPTGPSHHYCSDFCRKFIYADKHYKRKYGVGIIWVLNKLEEQSYKCAICRTAGFKMMEEHISGLNLDHCHASGVPRALLCHNCNRGLGLFQDNPNYLRSAATYLEETYEPTRYEEYAPGAAKRIVQQIIRRQKKGEGSLI